MSVRELEETKSSAKVLVVTHAYPSEADPYRNGFVHRRVHEYQKTGIACDVYVVNDATKVNGSYEYEGVSVTVCTGEDYRNRIRKSNYRVFLLHFATEAMTKPIVQHHPDSFIIAWVHGVEAEAWHRRWFNYVESAREIRSALEKRERYYKPQNEFMRWLIADSDHAIDIVHVSQWFKENIVEPDIGRVTRNSHVIPNYIDSDLFAYRAKDADDRLKILSLRPFASRKYANDLTAAAIVELARRPYFEALQFTIRGDGKLFDKVTAPLLQYPNVSVDRGLLEQHQIPELHAAHGVFLAPTRFDSQGVSMCEAMSSGLVPISTRIAAIPEFVDDYRTGMLAEPESPVSIADRIERLFYNPTLFTQMSSAAAERVRQQCGPEATTRREAALIHERLGGE